MTQCATVTALPTGPRTPRQVDEHLALNGKCAGGDPDLWFPNQAITADMAREACAGCPLISACLERALQREAEPFVGSWGIWGGASPDERRAVIRNRQRRAHAAQVRAELQDTGVAS